jgi:hypothetical protein
VQIRGWIDRVDAERAAPVFALRAQAGRRPLAEKLRLIRILMPSRTQLPVMRKRLPTQVCAPEKHGNAAMVRNNDTALQQRFDSLTKDRKDTCIRAIANAFGSPRRKWVARTA